MFSFDHYNFYSESFQSHILPRDNYSDLMLNNVA